MKTNQPLRIGVWLTFPLPLLGCHLSHQRFERCRKSGSHAMTAKHRSYQNPRTSSAISAGHQRWGVKTTTFTQVCSSSLCTWCFPLRLLSAASRVTFCRLARLCALVLPDIITYQPVSQGVVSVTACRPALSTSSHCMKVSLVKEMLTDIFLTYHPC